MRNRQTETEKVREIETDSDIKFKDIGKIGLKSYLLHAGGGEHFARPRHQAAKSFKDEVHYKNIVFPVLVATVNFCLCEPQEPRLQTRVDGQKHVDALNKLPRNLNFYL